MTGLASDHAGYALKTYVKEYLASIGEEYMDYGCPSEESCDYPDYAHALADGLARGECQRGIAICGSGEGISIVLNKHQHVRAALVWRPDIARLSRQHNDANVLVMPGRFITQDEAREIMSEFLSTPFEGGRHLRRIEKIPVKVKK